MTKSCRTCKTTKPERQYYGTSRECMACAKARYKRNMASAKMRLQLLETVAREAREAEAEGTTTGGLQHALERLDAWEKERD